MFASYPDPGAGPGTSRASTLTGAIGPIAFLLGFIVLPPAARAGSWEIGYSFPAPSSQTNGLTWDGRSLWHTNDLSPIIYKINPEGGAVLGTVPTQVPDQGDLEFAGGSLWVVSENDHYIHEIDPATGKTVDTIKVLGIPEGRPGRFNQIQLEGLTFDGRNIWVDGNTSYIIKIDPVKRTQHLYVMPPEMGYVDGLTWAFDHLWVVTNNATIYELDPCSMGVLDQFDAPAEVGGGPEGFAFDGENLWFADNTRDEIYKIILKDKILTKRAAGARESGSSAANGCNQGILLTSTPVPVGEAGRSAPAGPPGRDYAEPFGHGARAVPVWPTPAGSSTDAVGRIGDDR